MRKSFYSLLAMAMCLFVSTSCSGEELTYEGGDKQNVTFQVEMEDAGTGSRALSDGSNVDVVYYAVYESGKDQLLTHGDETVSNGAASVIIPLVNGLKFDIVFFAHCTNGSAFDVPSDGDLRNIQMKGSLKANQEAYDAFFHARKEFQTTSNTTTPVTLKRPLAQLNVATTDEDLVNAGNLNATVTHSKVVLKGVPTSFDARSGIASGSENVTFETEAILKQADGTNEQLIVGTEQFNYLAMAYVLVNDESGLFDSEFEFYRADEDDQNAVGDMVSKRVIPNLPLQRNYRTNVTGNILTQNENFSITLDTDFDNIHHVEASDITVKDLTELNTALAKLAKQNTKELILNVKGLSTCTDVAINIPDDATVSSITLNLLDLPASVTKLNVTGENNVKPVLVSIPTTTTVTTTTINVPNAHVTLKKGTHTQVISSTSPGTLEVAAGTVITNLTVKKGNVEIKNDGTVGSITTDGTLDITVSVEPGGTLTNVPTSDNIKVETTLENIGEEWILTENVELMGPISIATDKTMTIDLNGYTIRQESSLASSYAMINNQGTLTITDNSTAKKGKLIFATTNPSTANAYASNTISNYGDIIIKGGTIENISETGGACYALDNYAGSTAKIEGGKLTATKTTVRIFQWTEGEDNAAKLEITGGEILSKDGYGINLNMGNAPHAEVKISGGTITTNDEDYNLAFYAVNQTDAENLKIQVSGGTFNGYFALNGTTSTTFTEGNVSITDGTFEGVICYDTPVCGFISGGTFSEDPSGYLSEGCEAVKEGDVWTINKLNSISFAAFNQALYEKNGVYEAAVEDELIVVLKDSERSYQNNKTCQFFLASVSEKWNDPNALETITIKNVTFKFIDDDTSNTYTSGELQVFANNMTFENCTFVGTAVSPWGAASTGEDCETASFAECTFKDLNGRYGIHQNQADKLTVTDCNFMDCERGIHTNSKTPESITITGNTFTGIGEGYGMLCLAENGDYTNVTLNITGNNAEGQVCLRQLNQTVTTEQITAIFANNIYGTKFVAGSIDPSPVAQIGDTMYKTLQEAFNAGGEITLLRDVTLSETAVLATGKTATLDLNGKTLSHTESKSKYAINNLGTLTIKNGTVNARGIYNGYDAGGNYVTTAKLTVESGTYNALGTDGGAAIFNYGDFEIKGGTFDGQVAAVNSRSGKGVINGGTFRSVSNYVIQTNGANAEIEINNATIDAGFGAVGCYAGSVEINDGEFLPTGMKAKTCHVVYVAKGTEVTINGGTYKMNYPETAVPDSGTAVTSYYEGKVVITGGKFYAHFDNFYPVELSGESTINGGTYLDHSGNPVNHTYITNFVAEGYALGTDGQVVKNQNN